MVAFALPLLGAIGSVISAHQQKKAAQSASNVQQATTQASIDEQRRQFDHVQNLSNPYVQTGQTALGQQGDLMGLNGFDKQQNAINTLNNSPFLQSAYSQAENALLQNASATGGLRGGNMQSALADNRMNMLHQAYQGQLQNLGGMVSLGQNSAVGVGNQGMNLANNVSQLNQNMGQAQAGYHLAKRQGYQNALNGLLGSASLIDYDQFKGWF